MPTCTESIQLINDFKESESNIRISFKISYTGRILRKLDRSKKVDEREIVNLPPSIESILYSLNMSKFEFSAIKGIRKYSAPSFQPYPAGTFLLAEFRNHKIAHSTTVKAFGHLRNSFSAALCTSLNSKGIVSQPFVYRHSSKKHHSDVLMQYFPFDTMCVENIKTIMGLLPCGDQAGLGMLMRRQWLLKATRLSFSISANIGEPRCSHALNSQKNGEHVHFGSLKDITLQRCVTLASVNISVVAMATKDSTGPERWLLEQIGKQDIQYHHNNVSAISTATNGAAMLERFRHCPASGADIAVQLVTPLKHDIESTRSCKVESGYKADPAAEQLIANFTSSASPSLGSCAAGCSLCSADLRHNIWQSQPKVGDTLFCCCNANWGSDKAKDMMAWARDGAPDKLEWDHPSVEKKRLHVPHDALHRHSESKHDHLLIQRNFKGLNKRQLEFSVHLAIINPLMPKSGTENTDTGKADEGFRQCEFVFCDVEVIELLPVIYSPWVHTYQYRIIPLSEYELETDSYYKPSRRERVDPTVIHSWALVADLPSFRITAATHRSAAEDLEYGDSSSQHQHGEQLLDKRTNPLRQGFGSMSWSVSLNRGFVLQARFEARRQFVRREYHPPDASRGMEAPPAFITISYCSMTFSTVNDSANLSVGLVEELGLMINRQQVNRSLLSQPRCAISEQSDCFNGPICSGGSSGREIQGQCSDCVIGDIVLWDSRINVSGSTTTCPRSFLYVTDSALLPALIPDFSMPFNVITLVSTIIAFLFGSMINVLVRKPKVKKP